MTAEDRAPSHEQIATVAYFHWLERGAPLGTPEEDWYRAEHTLAERAGSSREADAPPAGKVKDGAGRTEKTGFFAPVGIWRGRRHGNGWTRRLVSRTGGG